MYDSTGKFIAGTKTEIAIKASVQPPSFGDQQSFTLNEKFGTSTDTMVVVYTKEELSVDKEATSTVGSSEADILIYENKYYKVVSRQPLDTIKSLKHRQYYAVEIPEEQALDYE